MKNEKVIGANRLRKESNFKGCFHANDECDAKIIKAHSISNSRVLHRISEGDDGNVMFMNLVGGEDGTNYVLDTTGRGKASIFNGFCKKHDMEIFQAIDDSEYEPHDLHQEYLFAYRSLAKEYHAKQTTVQMTRRLIELLARRDITELHKYWPGYSLNEGDLVNLIGFQMKALESLAELEKVRTIMNHNLDRKRFWKLHTWVFELDKEYPIAVSAVMDGALNMHAKSIDEKQLLPPSITLFTLFPQNGKTYALFSVPKHTRIFHASYDEMLTKPMGLKKLFLSHLIVRWTENFVIGRKYWLGFTPEWREWFQNEWEGSTQPYTFVQAALSPHGINLFRG